MKKRFPWNTFTKSYQLKWKSRCGIANPVSFGMKFLVYAMRNYISWIYVMWIYKHALELNIENHNIFVCAQLVGFCVCISRVAQKQFITALNKLFHALKGTINPWMTLNGRPSLCLPLCMTWQYNIQGITERDNCNGVRKKWHIINYKFILFTICSRQYRNLFYFTHSHIQPYLFLTLWYMEHLLYWYIVCFSSLRDYVLHSENDIKLSRQSVHIYVSNMMTSSNGNIFRVTGHLYGEFTGPRWIPRTKASDAGLWCFLWFASE